VSFDDIPLWLAERREQNLYRRRRVVESPQGRELLVSGKRLLNFCSNDYLGLASDVRVLEAFKLGADTWGVGSGASHLICGHTRAHHDLEEALADFVGRPRALLFSSGYAANMGTINSLVGAGDFVFQDRLNHASLLDGGWISRAAFSWYDHADAGDLQRQLQDVTAADGRRLVVSDGTFSMDGDCCPLTELVKAARQQNAWVMIDDAHGLGVCGNQGRGLVDPDNYSTRDVPVLVGTLGKAFGTAGAFVAGEDSLIELLIHKARNYVFSTAIPSAVAVATQKSLEIVIEENWRREHLHALIRQFKAGVKTLGFELGASDSPIQPLVVGAADRAVQLSERLEQAGILISAIRPPTVPEGTSRLRITLTAAHTTQDVDRLVDALGAAHHAFV
jgi:8-amino-7-oxononanoate synthase